MTEFGQNTWDEFLGSEPPHLERFCEILPSVLSKLAHVESSQEHVSDDSELNGGIKLGRIFGFGTSTQ